MLQCSVWTGRREETHKPAAVPLNDLRVLLRLAREQYLKMQKTIQPKVSCVSEEKENHTSVTGGNHLYTGFNPTLKKSGLVLTSTVLFCSRLEAHLPPRMAREKRSAEL